MLVGSFELPAFNWQYLPFATISVSFRPAEITDLKCVEALHIPIALAVLYTDS